MDFEVTSHPNILGFCDFGKYLIIMHYYEYCYINNTTQCTIIMFSIYEIIHFHKLHTYLNNKLEMQLLFLWFPLKGCNLFYGRVFSLFDFSLYRCGKPLKNQLQFYGLNHKKATEQPLNFGIGEKNLERKQKHGKSMETSFYLGSLHIKPIL